MIKLNKYLYAEVFARYKRAEFFFPLVGAVLLDEQEGVVYADDPLAPSQVYVEHAFGFAQVIGQTNPAFQADLEQYLLIDRSFASAKVRLYAPSPAFLGVETYAAWRAFRQRFVIDPDNVAALSFDEAGRSGELIAVAVDESNIDLVEQNFGLVQRFWRTPRDFIHKANAVVAFYKGESASICYAAAQADGKVEIDVLTRPEFRRIGAGRFVVTHFVRRCFEKSLQPLWDCFTNNAGSMNLCRAVGFHASMAPYPFFTIPRQDAVTS